MSVSKANKWIKNDYDHGFIEFKLTSWKDFSEFINEEMLEYTNYVYRGHANSNWKLEPTLDRVITDPESSDRDDHLLKFKYETRGRRGPNPPNLENENDWWALGQHHGLHTPLLDWTESPFVALYFAAATAENEDSDEMVVYSLFQNGVNRINYEIKNSTKINTINGHKPTVKIVRPLSDENSRLVSQRGLFTRGPNNVDLESWVKQYTELDAELENIIVLIKITMPKDNIAGCLRYLNRMNISHSTLFPDLAGATEFCNKHLIISKY
jgi:hypothetical protein